jgi:GxxExxY protein
MVELLNRVIEIANDIYSNIGPGYNEILYHRAFEVGLRLNNIDYNSEVITPIFYKGHNIGHGRVDLIISNRIIIELKALSSFNLDTANVQIKNYINHYNLSDGLIINFGQPSKISDTTTSIGIKYVSKINGVFKIYKYLNGSFVDTEINII